MWFASTTSRIADATTSDEPSDIVNRRFSLPPPALAPGRVVPYYPARDIAINLVRVHAVEHRESFGLYPWSCRELKTTTRPANDNNAGQWRGRSNNGGTGSGCRRVDRNAPFRSRAVDRDRALRLRGDAGWPRSAVDWACGTGHGRPASHRTASFWRGVQRGLGR